MIWIFDVLSSLILILVSAGCWWLVLEKPHDKSYQRVGTVIAIAILYALLRMWA